jgi:hypothetical protein
MFSKEKLSKFLFFDIETCGKYRDYADFKANDPDGAEIFKKKSNRLGYPNPEEGYRDKISLFPEFGRIACLSYGIWKDGKITIATISDDDEKELLKKVYALFVKVGANGMIPTGWNIKNFDVAWVYRKLLMHGLQVPECLNTYDKKPWEVNIFDMKEWWRVFSNLDVSFEDAAYGMGIPSPKDDIDGGMVHHTFWNGEIDRVVTYCEKDVKTMIVMCEKIYQIYQPSTLAGVTANFL